MLKYFLLFITAFSFAQQKECLVVYTDETKTKGYATITDDATVEFATTIDGKVETLDFATVKRVIIYAETPITYSYEKVSKEGDPILLKRLNKNNTYPGNEIIVYVSAKEAVKKVEDYTKYYLKRRLSDEVTTINSSLTPRKWKYKMIKYLKGCPTIIETLRFGGYSKATMVKLIEDYNSDCS